MRAPKPDLFQRFPKKTMEIEMSVLGQKRDPAKATKKRDPYVLPDEKLQRREAVYLIYKGMEPMRFIEIDPLTCLA
jgi:hypothetical protein